LARWCLLDLKAFRAGLIRQAQNGYPNLQPWLLDLPITSGVVSLPENGGKIGALVPYMSPRNTELGAEMRKYRLSY